MLGKLYRGLDVRSTILDTGLFGRVGILGEGVIVERQTLGMDRERC